MLLRWIDTFLKLTENKNFSKTAKEMYLTQPTISKQISQLEAELGVVLINRNFKKFSLTKAGEILYSHSIKIIKDIEMLKKDIENFKGLKEGEIVIGASTLPGEYILPKIIYSFKKEHPDININIIIKDSFKCIEDLKNGKMEFIIVGHKINDNSLNFKNIFDDEIIFVYNKHSGKINIDKLRHLPIIAREYGSGTMFAVKKYFELAGISFDSLNFIAKMGSLNAVKEMVKSGIGYAFISKIAVEEELKEKKIFEIEIENITPIKRKFYTVISKNLALSPASKNFLQLLSLKLNSVAK